VTSYRIPFNRACLTGREQEYVLQAVANGHISGSGNFTKRCERLLQDITGTKRAMLTTSCTHALEMSALLLDIRPGDEVIIPSFTFVSTANAFVLHGARPVFADIRPDTLNIDESVVETLITPRTRAIVPVHYAGVGCDMDVITDIAKRHQVAVVEDNAHGLFGTYRGQSLGTFGSVGTLSFHETKNVTCGEGGALLVNDSELIERAEIIRDKGTDRGRFFRGQVDKYSWVDIGSSYVLSDILAAFLCAQLESRDVIQEHRRQIWYRYCEGLAAWAEAEGVTLPRVPRECEQAYHMFFILLPSLERRSALINHLQSRGILGVFHYVPLHLSSMGRRFGGGEGDCPVAEDVSDRLLRLPFFNDLCEEEQSDVISTIVKSSHRHQVA
jgi:dTDP-4-amino-4,6-dideoxygalactose transaminase